MDIGMVLITGSGLLIMATFADLYTSRLFSNQLRHQVIALGVLFQIIGQMVRW